VHGIGNPTSKSFYSFRDIVDNNQDVPAAF
jgi:hypothetical protein